MGRNKPGKQRHDRHGRRQRSTPAAANATPAVAAISTANSSPAWLYPLLLALLGLGVYANSLAAPFHFDDWGFIVSEPGVQQLWPIEGHANRPVLTFSLALSNAVFGMQPLGFRLVNVVIHVLAGLLLFGSVRRILRQERLGFGPRAAAGFGFAVAALWLVHPLQTQAVTYIWQRSKSLMGLFFFAALYALVRAATGSSARLWGLLVPVFCLLGLGTKEVMVAIFPVLLLVDGVLLSASLREALRKRWLLYGAFAALVAVLLLVVLPDTATSMGKVTRLDYALSQPGVVLRYLRLALWPHPLSFDYGL